MCAGRIHGEHARSRHAERADFSEHATFDFEVVVALRSVFHSHERLRLSDACAKGSVVSLPASGLEREFLIAEIFAQHPLHLWLDVWTTHVFRRAVKSGRTIALPVVDAPAAHADGGRRFQIAAAMPPRTFCMTPLKTPAAAASGMAAK